VSDVWRHKDEVAVVAGENRVVVLDLDRLDQAPVVLTDSAAVIWQLVDGRRGDDAVVREVAEWFEVSEDEVRHHVLGYLEELAARDLLVRTRCPSP
jgi:hypothetical protein